MKKCIYDGREHTAAMYIVKIVGRCLKRVAAYLSCKVSLNNLDTTYL